MQTNIQKELTEIVKQLKVYLEETKEQDFWQLEQLMLVGKKKRTVPFSGDSPYFPKKTKLEELYKKIKGCQNCPLHKTRINLVLGCGNPAAKLMLIGEAPGYDEDRQGEPFVGKAGQLLNKIIEAIGLKREEVYITNVVKCHPLRDERYPERRGNDRPPDKEEIIACLPILEEQISIIQPKIICTLGTVAGQTLLASPLPLTKLRGQFYDCSLHLPMPVSEMKLLPTFHPAALLRNPSLKRPTWEDFKKIQKVLSQQ